MHKLATTVVACLVLAGCGSQNIEDRVKSEYPDYGKNHGMTADARKVDRVTCTHDATPRYDGWCSVHVKGFTLTYDVPYKGDKLFWGKSGPMEAPDA